MTARDLLKTHFPISVRSCFVPTLLKAYQLTKLHCSSTPYLNWEIGDDEKPNIRRVIVDYSLRKIVLEGKVPFQCHIEDNAAKNCRHLELKYNNIILTTNHLNQGARVPRKAIFRDQLAKSNQISLFPLYDDIEVKTGGVYHAILCHECNGDRLVRAFLGIPSKNRRERWLDIIDLLKEPWQTFHPVTPEEEITEEDLVALRDDLFRKREDNER